MIYRNNVFFSSYDPDKVKEDRCSIYNERHIWERNIDRFHRYASLFYFNLNRVSSHRDQHNCLYFMPEIVVTENFLTAGSGSKKNLPVAILRAF